MREDEGLKTRGIVTSRVLCVCHTVIGKFCLCRHWETLRSIPSGSIDVNKLIHRWFKGNPNVTAAGDGRGFSSHSFRVGSSLCLFVIISVEHTCYHHRWLTAIMPMAYARQFAKWKVFLSNPMNSTNYTAFPSITADNNCSADSSSNLGHQQAVVVSEKGTSPASQNEFEALVERLGLDVEDIKSKIVQMRDLSNRCNDSWIACQDCKKWRLILPATQSEISSKVHWESKLRVVCRMFNINCSATDDFHASKSMIIDYRTLQPTQAEVNIAKLAHEKYMRKRGLI